MLKAIFVGMRGNLPCAYPEELRREIEKRVTLIPESLEGEEWKERLPLLAEADLIFSSWGMPVLDQAFLEAAPRLRAVFYAAGSVKCFATPHSYERGILISSAWEANAIPVSEYTLGTILLGLKGFWSSSRQMKAGTFDVISSPIPGAYRSKVGLVSLGAIGKRVAALLARFDLDVLVYDPYVKSEQAAELGVSLVSLEELFERCDVVSLHTPWLPETENLIGGGLVVMMKPGACLINTSRGAIVNEAEICVVLRDRPDLTAILDVTYPEPPSTDSPLHALGNVVLTPHIAGSVGGEVARMGAWMLEEFDRYLAGKPLLHGVSLEMLDHMA